MRAGQHPILREREMKSRKFDDWKGGLSPEEDKEIIDAAIQLVDDLMERFARKGKDGHCLAVISAAAAILEIAFENPEVAKAFTDASLQLNRELTEAMFKAKKPEDVN
jgi:hypothetical protein